MRLLNKLKSNSSQSGSGSSSAGTEIHVLMPSTGTAGTMRIYLKSPHDSHWMIHMLPSLKLWVEAHGQWAHEEPAVEAYIDLINWSKRIQFRDQGVFIHTVLCSSGITGALPFRIKPSNKSRTLLLADLFRHVPNLGVISSPALRWGNCGTSSLQVLRWQRGMKEGDY